jgi:uncharacterized protein (TIGR02246 family)
MRNLNWLVISLAVAVLGLSLVGDVGARARSLHGIASNDAIETDWAAALRDKDVDKLASLYAEDAVFLTPGGRFIVGRQAIRQLLVGAEQAADWSIHFSAQKLLTAPGQIVACGDYSQQMTKIADHSVHQLHGTYAMTLRRNPRGGWAIAMQMWTEVE